MPHRHLPILVIDDDASLRELAREALADEGYDALTLGGHDEALDALRGCRFALILADTAGVGAGDPWPALEAVREAARETPVAIFSAHNPSALAGYADRGFAGLISKPFDLDDFLGTVRTLLTGQTETPAV